MLVLCYLKGIPDFPLLKAMCPHIREREREAVAINMVPREKALFLFCLEPHNYG